MGQNSHFFVILFKKYFSYWELFRPILNFLYIQNVAEITVCSVLLSVGWNRRSFWIENLLLARLLVLRCDTYYKSWFLTDHSIPKRFNEDFICCTTIWAPSDHFSAILFSKRWRNRPESSIFVILLKWWCFSKWKF